MSETSGIQHTQTIRSPIGEWRIYEDKTPPEERDKIVFPNLITSTRKLTELVAYRLWEEAGRPHGRSEEFWFEAERQLDEAGYDLRCPSLMGKGVICCPYTPADTIVLDPKDFNPKRGILTRYGKKLLRDQAERYQRKSVGDAVMEGLAGRPPTLPTPPLSKEASERLKEILEEKRDDDAQQI